MTILFYTRYQPVKEKGGTEHTTITVAKQLSQRYGVRCIASYSMPFPGTQEGFDDYCFIDFKQERKQVIERIADILTRYEVDHVVLQGYFRETGFFREAVNQCPHCRLIFSHHFAPGWEQTQEVEVLERLQKSKGLKRLRYQLKLRLFPLFRWLGRKKLERRYRKAYRAANHVVVLSSSYVDEFSRWADAPDTDNISVIPNALPFQQIFDVSNIGNKEKLALIVTRLDERQKRIRLALQLWKEAKQHPDTEGWRLIIIGDGEEPCTHQYQAWAKDNLIPDVEFLGRCNPFDYYAKASIFLMTSLCEGLPLTILEARQQAVVPLAFNTFKAIDDIITNGENGFILTENDRQSYVDCLRKLMGNRLLREKMAVDATKGLEDFSTEEVMKRWMELMKTSPNRPKK